MAGLGRSGGSCKTTMGCEVVEGGDHEDEEVEMVNLGSYGGKVRLLIAGEESAAEETMLLWGIQQPTLSKPNAFVSQSSLQLCLDSCGQSLRILQSPSSLVCHLFLLLLYAISFLIDQC